MPQFPMIESRRAILERIPDYEVAISDFSGSVLVSLNGQTLAKTSKALLVQETRHSDVFYLPRGDVNLSLLTPTDHSTYCPFKGHASYFSFQDQDQDWDNVVWSYEDPYPEVSELEGYLSFYTDRVEQSVIA